MIRITFFADQGCMFSGIAGLVDAFSIANLWHSQVERQGTPPLFETEIVTPDGRPVRANAGIHVQPDRAMGQVEGTDMVMIPPFLPYDRALSPPSAAVCDWLCALYDAKARIGAMCTGVFLLAHTGLLDGRRATTNWQFARAFRRHFPKVRLCSERLLTEDGRLLCAGGATAAYHLGLAAIAFFSSDNLAANCAKLLLVDTNRESQAPYVIFNQDGHHSDPDILRAQRWMEAHFNENFPMDDIAQRVGISPRHFKRRFKKATGESPLAYLQQLRIEVAKKQLEITDDSINAITWRIGYQDSSTFRRLFKKFTGLSPRAYREKFARPGTFSQASSF